MAWVRRLQVGVGVGGAEEVNHHAGPSEAAQQLGSVIGERAQVAPVHPKGVGEFVERLLLGHDGESLQRDERVSRGVDDRRSDLRGHARAVVENHEVVCELGERRDSSWRKVVPSTGAGLSTRMSV